ncbi:MAG TPA: hypothetical protein VN461_17650 [Vicinamibacteria bacterium]|nr:hypothetical protein [Vicinamibacteria bacterium]
MKPAPQAPSAAEFVAVTTEARTRLHRALRAGDAETALALLRDLDPLLDAAVERMAEWLTFKGEKRE